MAIVTINYKGETKSFNVVENTDFNGTDKFGVKISTLEGIPCYSAVNVHWADKDAIEKVITDNMEQILEIVEKKKPLFAKSV